MNDNDLLYELIFSIEKCEWLVDIEGLIWKFNSKETAEAFIGISKEALVANAKNPKAETSHVVLIRRPKYGIH